MSEISDALLVKIAQTKRRDSTHARKLSLVAKSDVDRDFLKATANHFQEEAERLEARAIELRMLGDPDRQATSNDT